MKQIILITDGCSNEGLDPAAASAQARIEGITVNVIGIVSEGGIGEYGIEEIQGIAQAGGGMSRLVSMEQLTQTVQMMTRQTVMNSVRQTVNEELRHIIGESTAIEQLPPDKRSKVVHVMEDLSETASMRVGLLIDASASMRPKLQAVKEAICDLMLSLQARQGKSEVAAFHFPGNRRNESNLVMDMAWTSELAKANDILYKINMKGTTPTGPALLQMISHFANGSARIQSLEAKPYRGNLRDSRESGVAGDGMLGDYII